MTNRLVIVALAAVFGLAASACKSNTTEEAATTDTPAAATESHEGHQMAKVYFKEPQDGATVPTLTKFVFGVDNYQISPVPPEAKDARPNMGHFHLGVDTDCLAPGTTIPKAEEGATARNRRLVDPFREGHRQHRDGAHAGAAQVFRRGGR